MTFLSACSKKAASAVTGTVTNYPPGYNYTTFLANHPTVVFIICATVDCPEENVCGNV